MPGGEVYSMGSLAHRCFLQARDGRSAALPLSLLLQSLCPCQTSHSIWRGCTMMTLSEHQECATVAALFRDYTGIELCGHLPKLQVLDPCSHCGRHACPCSCHLRSPYPLSLGYSGISGQLLPPAPMVQCWQYASILPSHIL